MNTTPIKIGCGEWGFRELEMPRHFEIARRLGFHCLEIGIGGGQVGRLPESMSAQDIREFDLLRKSHDIETPFVCIENDFTLASPEAHADVLAQTLESIRLAASLGATHVRLFAGFTPAAQMTEALWFQIGSAITTCSELCASLNLQIALETHGKITMIGGVAHHENTVSTDPAALSRLIRLLPANVGFNYDPGNLKAVNPGDREYALSILRGHINYCHLKDWMRRGDGWTAVAIGDDDLDYASLLPAVGFSGTYLIEYEPTGDVVDGITRSLDYLRRIGIPWQFA